MQVNPSQKGLDLLNLHPHKYTFYFSSIIVNLTGSKAVCKCELSHKGYLLDIPQEHHWYSLFIFGLINWIGLNAGDIGIGISPSYSPLIKV